MERTSRSGYAFKFGDCGGSFTAVTPTASVLPYLAAGTGRNTATVITHPVGTPITANLLVRISGPNDVITTETGIGESERFIIKPPSNESELRDGQDYSASIN